MTTEPYFDFGLTHSQGVLLLNRFLQANASDAYDEWSDVYERLVTFVARGVKR